MWKKHEPFEKIQDDEYFDFTNFTNTDTAIDQYACLFDLFDEVKEELQSDVFIGPNEDKTLSLLDWERSDSDNIIEGVFAKGRTGRRADHLPVDEAQLPENTPEEVREPNAREENTAAEERYFFLIYIPPEDPRRALLLTHLHGVGGIIGLFRNKLSRKLAEIGDEIKYRTTNIAGEKIINKLEDEPILGFELVKKGVNTQEHLRLSNDLGSNAQESKVKVNIRATSGDQWTLSRGELERLAGRDDFDYAEILPSEVDSESTFEPDKLKVLVEQNGRSRKVDLTNERVTVETELFPSQLNYSNGRLSMSSVGCEARRIANETLDRENFSQLDTDESLLEDSRTDV
jgi:hypothetical protein